MLNLGRHYFHFRFVRLFPESFCFPFFTLNIFLLFPQVPQMILISFNGAVNVDNFKIYEEIFNEKNAINPNNCTAKGTFFVSHKYTNYSAVQVMLDLLRFFSIWLCCWAWSRYFYNVQWGAELYKSLILEWLKGVVIADCWFFNSRLE